MRIAYALIFWAAGILSTVSAFFMAGAGALFFAALAYGIGVFCIVRGYLSIDQCMEG